MQLVRQPVQREAHRGDGAANTYGEEQRMKDRFASTLVIAAYIIAAVRLAREENITRSSPRLTTVIADCMALARMILDKVVP